MRQLLFLMVLLFLCACSATAQDVQGVYPTTHQSEVGAGFTYLRFYEVPNTTLNNAGFTLSGAYYLRDWLGVDVEFTDTFERQSGQYGQHVFGGGGARLRWPASKNLQLWIHALGGGAYLSPKTAYGDQSALGYEAGAGIDVSRHRSRIAVRLSADIVGTRFFGTYQFSPKVSAGVVYRF